MTGVVLSACVIVRDGDEERLAACLRSLHGHVEEIVTYDVGATDDEAHLRTGAVKACRGGWVLIVEPDERIAGASAQDLTRWLAASEAGTCTVETHVVDADGGHVTRVPRLVRRDGTVWTGRAHARPSNDLAPSEDTVPATLLRLTRDETADPRAARERAERSAAVGAEEVAHLQQGDDPGALARALLDLGTDLLALQRRVEAMQSLLIVRRLLDSGPVWAEATERLAGLARDAGHHALALTLSDDVRRDALPGEEPLAS